MASRVTGLKQRGSRWYVLVIVPPDLRGAFDWPRRNFALHTSDPHEAVRRALAKRHELETAFQAKRREMNPEVLAEVTPEMAAALAASVRTFVLAADDELRANLPLLAEMVHIRRELDRRAANSLYIPQWNPSVERVDDLTGLTADEATELAGINAHAEGESVIALARRSLTAVLPLVQAQAAKLGVRFDAGTPGARDALLASLSAYRTAHREVTLRDAGEVVDTPSQVTLTPAKRARTLRDVFDRWKLSGDSPKSADATSATDRALRQFEGQHPGLTLKDITRDQGDKYRSWLRETCGTPKTARDRLNAIKSLLKYAARDLQWTSRHSWEGLDIKAKTTSPRRPWTDDELKTFFASPLHTVYALPDSRYGGREAAYWIPLVGLFTGARLGELAQLRTVDVQESEGLHVLVLTDEGINQSIKSDAGHRRVPIHSELIRLGFVTYVESVRAAGRDSLWPALPLREGKPSDLFGRWFRDHRRGLGLKDKYPDFHCFRHTVRPLMRRAGTNEGTMDRITGHETPGSIGTKEYDHRLLLELQAAVETIRYPALKLPVVAPSRGR